MVVSQTWRDIGSGDVVLQVRDGGIGVFQPKARADAGPKDESGRSRLVSQKSPATMFFGFKRAAPGCLLLACSCASSDSASLPLR